MSETNLITTDKLCITRDGKKILKNISIEIKPKDFISLIGPNGAGKSMLIKSLMKLTKISSGTIKIKKRLKIGYVPQKLLIDSTVPISVIEFIKLREKNNADLEQKINQLLEQFKLEKLKDSLISEISGGEIQKVFLLKALLSEPDLLVLDEPEQNLDINSRIDFYSLLSSLYNQYEIAILLASHELNFVMKSTKKVICLYTHICCSGEPDFVAKDPEFIALFGEKSAEMVSIYRHDEKHHSHHHF